MTSGQNDISTAVTMSTFLVPVPFCHKQGLYPFSQTISRTFQGLRLLFFFRTPKFTSTLSLPRSEYYFSLLSVNTFLIMLVLRIHLLLEVIRFPEVSRTGCLFQGLSSPGKCLLQRLRLTNMNIQKTTRNETIRCLLFE